MSRARQAALLVGPTLRALPLARLAGCAVVAAAFVWALGGADAGHTILALQCAALALCVGAAAVVEDPAADTVAAVPPSLRFRRGLRLAVAAPALVLVWGALLWLGGVGAPWTGVLTLQFVALAAVTWALAAATPGGAAVAGPAVALTFLVVRLGLPKWMYATDPDAGAVRLLWIVLFAAGVLGLLLATRDPARRRVSPAPIRPRRGERARTRRARA